MLLSRRKQRLIHDLLLGDRTQAAALSPCRRDAHSGCEVSFDEWHVDRQGAGLRHVRCPPLERCWLALCTARPHSALRPALLLLEVPPVVLLHAQPLRRKIVHAGVNPDPITGAVLTPVFQSTTYIQGARLPCPRPCASWRSLSSATGQPVGRPTAGAPHRIL